MIQYRRWRQVRVATRFDCDGWFLFSFIPLYVRKVQLV